MMNLLTKYLGGPDGDLNTDGVVNVADVLLAQRILSSTVDLPRNIWTTVMWLHWSTVCRLRMDYSTLVLCC